MRKKLIICVILAILVAVSAFPVAAFANSAPVRYEPESLGLCAVYDKDIAVSKEKLAFDFTNAEIIDVSVKYDFVNNGEAKILNLAFPVIASWNDTFKGDYDNFKAPQIRVNGEQANVNFLFARDVESTYTYQNLSFEEILKQCNETNAPVNLPMKRYELGGYGKARIEYEAGAYYGISFYYNMDCRSKGVYSKAHTFDTSVIYTTASVATEGDYIEIIDEREATAEEMFAEFAQIYDVPTSLMRMNFGYLGKSGNDYSASELAYGGRQMLTLMTFDMPFNSGANTLEVSYQTFASCDSHYNPDVYSHAYLSNPAKNWADFGTFECEIITSMYLIEQSYGCDFEQTDTGYRFIRQGLPEENVSFKLCEIRNPRETNWAWLFVLIGAIFMMFAMVAVSGGVALLVLVVWLIVRSHPKKETKRKYKAVDIYEDRL